MLILFILQGKVSIAASGPADKIHPSSCQQTHEQFGTSRIPDTLRIKYNFEGQAVEDLRIASQNALNLVSISLMRVQWPTLSGKRTNFYTYLATAQKSKYALVPIHTEEEFHLFNYSVSFNGNWFSPNGAP